MAGASLVLLTWLACLLVLVILGFAPAARGRSLAVVLRTSLWWGLLVATLVILAAGLFLPLRSTAAATAFLVVVVAMGAAAVMVTRRRAKALRFDLAMRQRWWLIALFVAIGLAVAYLAVAALGPVTNYDSGLYHLGAIKYAGDYSAIPGVANLYFPFGYNNSLFPLAAFLGNGPWDGQGFRMVNGLLLAAMAADLVIRLLQRRYSVGTFVMLVGFAVSWVPLIALSDYWVTSPSQDSSVFILTVVSAAYLSDALARSGRWQGDAAVAVVTGLLLVSMRPLMAFFTGVTVIVILVHAVRLRAKSGEEVHRGLWWAVAGLAVLLGIVQTARDYVLSGWLQYPLSLVPFDVAWRAPDPSWATKATLWAARDATSEISWQVASGWSWVSAWVGRLPSQWESFEFAVLVIVAVLALMIASRATGHRPRRAMLLAMAPSAVTLVVWWTVTPPSFRFVWGPLFMLAVVPLGWSLYALGRRGRRTTPLRPFVEPVIAVGLAVAMVVLLGYCALVRLDTASMTQVRTVAIGPVSVQYRSTPIRLPSTRDQVIEAGLVVRLSNESDQCWDVYPLCIGQLPASLHARGSSIQDGFTQ